MATIAQREAQAFATVGRHLQPAQRRPVGVERPAEHGRTGATAQALFEGPQCIARRGFDDFQQELADEAAKRRKELPLLQRIVKHFSKDRAVYRELVINAETLEKRVALLTNGVLVDVRTTIVNGHGVRRQTIQGSARNTGRATFQRAVLAAMPAATAGKLVTFGIVPTGPETGYGYIKTAAGPH